MIMYFNHAVNGHQNRSLCVQHMKENLLSQYISIFNLNVTIEKSSRIVQAVLRDKYGNHTHVEFIDVSNCEWVLFGSNNIDGIRKAIIDGWVNTWPSLARYV